MRVAAGVVALARAWQGALCVLMSVAAAAALAPRPTCSSLDGPYCSLINGKKAPLHSNGASLSSLAQAAGSIGHAGSNAHINLGTADLSAKSVIEALATAFSKSLVDEAADADWKELLTTVADKLSISDKPVVDNTPFQLGWFDIQGHSSVPVEESGIADSGSGNSRGDASVANSDRTTETGTASQTASKSQEKKSASRGVADFYMLPRGPFLLQPGLDWITVGLKGHVYVRKDQTLVLVATLVDDSGLVLEGCSQLVARRVVSLSDPKTFISQEQMNAAVSVKSMRRALDLSTWKGTYKCGSFPTELTLTINTLDTLTKESSPDSSRGRERLMLEGDFYFLVRKKQSANVILWFDESKNPPPKKYKPRTTRAGCKCAFAWEDEKKNTFFNGVCSKRPKDNKSFCKIDHASCAGIPEHTTWDFCDDDILGTDQILK